MLDLVEILFRFMLGIKLFCYRTLISLQFLLFLVMIFYFSQNCRLISRKMKKQQMMILSFSLILIIVN